MIQLAQANAVRLPLGDGVVSLCVTSPPYLNLRDYGVDGQIGLEKTPDEYIAKLVEVFRDVRRVLAPDGLCFVNLGDSYASSPTGSRPGPCLGHGPHKEGVKGRQSKIVDGLKPKDLCLIPQRAAIALQADGWWVRSFMPWAKNNCLPESVRDRPTTSHEYWIMLAKSRRYYWDQEAVRVGAVGAIGGAPVKIHNDGAQGKHGKTSTLNTGWKTPASTRNRRTSDTWLDGLDAMIDEQRRYLAHLVEIRDGTGMLAGRDGEPLGVRFNTASYKGAHFATFGAKMIVPFVKAGSSERGVCPVCRKAFVRVVEKSTGGTIGKSWHPHTHDTERGNSWTPNNPGHNYETYRRGITTGWRATCNHDAEPIPALVLDPFCGTATTLEVARSLGRDAVGFDLSLPYLRDQARERLSLTALDAWLMDQGRPGGDDGQLVGLPMFDVLDAAE